MKASVEPGGLAVSREGQWLVARQPVPSLASHSAEELLRLTQYLQSPLRYARTPQGVVLVGECPLGGELEDVARARERLLQQVQGEWRDTTVPDATLLAEALAEISGVVQRNDAWIVPASERWPTELQVRAVAGGVRVQAILVQLPGEPDREVAYAVVEFLCRAQSALRFSRVEHDGSVACIATEVATEVLHSHLPPGVGAVAAGWRSLAREARALADPGLARKYLQTVTPGFATRELN